MKNFQLVWEDNTGEYDKLKIYKVPDEFRPGAVNNQQASQPGEQPPPAQCPREQTLFRAGWGTTQASLTGRAVLRSIQREISI
jgi:hypothetical protein